MVTLEKRKAAIVGGSSEIGLATAGSSNASRK
jgi:NAD(P)-dependent dehydrogenase (short-subunit alcohol dehydrogenase family)